MAQADPPVVRVWVCLFAATTLGCAETPTRLPIQRLLPAGDGAPFAVVGNVWMKAARLNSGGIHKSQAQVTRGSSLATGYQGPVHGDNFNKIPISKLDPVKMIYSEVDSKSNAGRWIAVRDGRWKYHAFFEGVSVNAPETQRLCDLSEDPQERRPIQGSHELDRLRQAAITFRRAAPIVDLRWCRKNLAKSQPPRPSGGTVLGGASSLLE